MAASGTTGGITLDVFNCCTSGHEDHSFDSGLAPGQQIMQQAPPEDLPSYIPPPVAGVERPDTPKKKGKELPPELQGLTGLDEHKALLFASWCCYCCCAGCGSSPVSTSPSYDTKCFCCYQKCRQDSDTSTGGCCSCTHTCCCTTLACQLPPRSGHPYCKVCNVECCRGLRLQRNGARKAGNSNQTMQRADALLEMLVPCYCCCAGCGMLPGFLEVCNNRMTCCCCENTVAGMMSSCEEESLQFGWCGCFLTCYKLYGQCKLPFLCQESPVLACCGKKCRHRS